MTPHYQQLRSYVVAVASDMIRRGKIRRKYGQSIEGVLKSEGASIFTEIRGDLTALAAELGIGAAGTLAQSASRVAHDGLDRLIQAGIEELIGTVTGKGSRR